MKTNRKHLPAYSIEDNPPEGVDRVFLIELEGKPGVCIHSLDYGYAPYRAYMGLQIHLISEFLRSFNTGLGIKFESYTQFNELLNQFNDIIKNRTA